MTDVRPDADSELPRWSTADVFESFTSRPFVDAMERLASDVERLVARFDEAGVRAVEPRTPTPADAETTASVIDEYNRTATQMMVLRATAYAAMSTDTRDEQAQALLSEIEARGAKVTPLVARLADWVASLGADELAAWPTVAAVSAAAMNAIKGEANAVNRRRAWASPLDASLHANSVSRPTYEAMNAAIDAALPRFRSWMRTKARLHGHDGPLPWWDLTAPLPVAPGGITWDEGVRLVREAFASYSGPLASLVDRAIAERWIDVAPRDGKVGGAFCMSFVDDRSLVLLNWSGSVDSAQTTAHELGHAYHNTQLAHRTPLQRQLPMALAETASIFCETLVVEAGLEHLQGADRLALLDVDLQHAVQVVVDIRSRVLFETEVFARRQRRTLGAGEMHDLMREAQAAAYGDGLDQSTAHPYMWVLKPHYYGSHFYNWPYTYGLLFGLGLFAQYRADPERFQAGYDDLLSRAGMDTAEELGAAFGLDVTDEAFWTASLDIIGDRIDQYEALAAELGEPS